MFDVEESPIDVPATRREMVGRLQELADPEVARTTQRFFPGKINCLGVRAADLRSLCQETHKKVRPFWRAKEALALAEALFEHQEIECRSCGLVILGYFNSGLKQRDIMRIRTWLRKGFLDNWALLDTLSLEVLGPFLLLNPAALKNWLDWAGDRNVYVRRAGLVALVKAARDEKNINLIFKAVRSAVRQEDQDDLVAKAAGWLLREVGKTNLRRLETFLLKFGRSLPRVTVRYALEKFSCGRKEYFMKITKK